MRARASSGASGSAPAPSGARRAPSGARRAAGAHYSARRTCPCTCCFSERINHISTYPSYLAYLPVSRRGAAGSRLVARETVESTVRSLRSERVAWYGRCRGLRFGTVLTLALDGSGVGAARRPSDSVLLYTPLGSPSIAAPSNLKGYMFSRGEPVDTDDIDEAITRNLWKNHRLLAPNLRILSHWFSLIITLVLVRTFCLKATLRTLCWRNNIVCVHVSCSTMQSTSPLSSASASSFRPQSIPCTSPLIFSVHCQSQSTLYALPHSHSVVLQSRFSLPLRHRHQLPNGILQRGL